MKQPFLAIVNPAAGAGRCGKLALPAMEELRRAGVSLEVAFTSVPGEGMRLAHQGYQSGFRRFLAVGGDGTSFEIVNGLFPAAEEEPPTLAFLPLGTGNSFLRDFTDRGAQAAREAILGARHRACDVLRLTHREGTTYYLNILSIGFPADVASLTNRRFKRLGELGYLFGVLACLIRMRRRAFPLRANGDAEWDQRRCLFLSFNNTQFTGGKMRIAPQADSGDGLIEMVRWGPIGRLGLIWNLHRLYDGSHVKHPLASRRAVRCVDFQLEAPVDIMIDGEVLRAHCERIDVLPSALRVMV